MVPIFFKERNGVFATNSDFINPISYTRCRILYKFQIMNSVRSNYLKFEISKTYAIRFQKYRCQNIESVGKNSISF